MRSLGELGVGLSVVFGVFVLALVAELCYIFYWKNSRFAKGLPADRPKSATEIAGKRRRQIAEFAREASFVGSFGGYPGTPSMELASDTSSDGFLTIPVDQPSHLLFPIKEETKEDMELAHACSDGYKPNARLRSRTPSDVLTIHFTSGSSSPAASNTPFTTPPSSPPAPPSHSKPSPYAAYAVWPFSVKPPSPSPLLEICSPSACCSSPPVSMRTRTSLRLLFERSPLFGPRPQSPGLPSPFREKFRHSSPAGSAAESHQDVGENPQPPPTPYQRLSLAVLFRQTAPCLPLSNNATLCKA